jgi:hypothetical protein
VCVCVCAVAILAQATAGPLPLVYSPPTADAMAESIIAELHGRLLRGIAAETTVHYQGLRAAASHLRRTGLLDSRLAKKLAAIDGAFAISRHITVVSAEQCVSEVLSAIAFEVKVAAEKENTEKETAEGLEEVMVNKTAAKVKADAEKAEQVKADEEQATKEVAEKKASLEKIAEQKAVEEKAAKVAEEAAAKDKDDAEKAAKAKAAEEQAAKAHAAHEAHKAIVGKVLARVGYHVPTPLFLELVAQVYAKEEPHLVAHGANEKKTAAEEQVANNEVAKRKEAAVATAKGKTDSMEKAAPKELTAKKAKVSKFDSVDMELEALAHRIGSMPSAAEECEWRRRGWR